MATITKLFFKPTNKNKKQMKAKGKTGTAGIKSPNKAAAVVKGKITVGGGNSKATMSAKKKK